MNEKQMTTKRTETQQSRTRFEETMPTTTPVMRKSPSPEALRKSGCDYVRKQVAKMFENSQVKDHTNAYPRFRKEEMVMGKVLGEGGFGIVYEICSIKKEPLRSASDDNYEMEEQVREFIAQHCIRDGSVCRQVPQTKCHRRPNHIHQCH
jgi:hypothetical protein